MSSRVDRVDSEGTNSASLAVPELSLGRRRSPRGFAFIITVFLVIAILVGVSFLVFSSQPPKPPTSDVVFQSPMLVMGNASFEVQNVSGGPYAYTGFRANLVVNNFAGQAVLLAPNNSAARIVIGPNTYRLVWLDSDGDGAVSVGDSFVVSGDGRPLPPLSDYEFDLQWQASWTVQVFWSTY